MFSISSQILEWAIPKKQQPLKAKLIARVLTAATLIDAVVSITALAIGVLRLFSVFHGLHALPPYGAYALIGLSSFITLMWAQLAIRKKGQNFKLPKDLLLGRVL